MENIQITYTRKVKMMYFLHNGCVEMAKMMLKIELKNI